MTEVSEFYLACRSGDLIMVNKILSCLTPDKTCSFINRIEPNKSTALHAASYYGHADIVCLLLRRGAARDLRNRFGATPLEEVSSPRIRELFIRTLVNSRFVADDVATEWTVAGHAEIEAAMLNYRYYMKATEHLGMIMPFIVNDEQIKNTEWIHELMPLFDQAATSNHALFLIQAYTKETPFYKLLNNTLAKDVLHWADEFTTPSSIWHRNFTAQLAKHPTLKKYKSWTGTCYRGMHLKKHEFDIYRENMVVVNKGFLSTSKSIYVAVSFLNRNEKGKSEGLIPVLCCYTIKWPAKALDISQLSSIPGEEEILLVPHKTAFRVKRVDRTKTPVVIELERYLHNNLFSH
jgi:hypothetical protein